MEDNKNIIYKQSFARFFAVQILFSYSFSAEKVENFDEFLSFLVDYYISDEFSKDNEEEYKKNINMNFFNEILRKTIENLNEIDSVLNNTIYGKYSFETIDNLIKTILRLAVYEFLYTQTDLKIIINEYVDIAGEYFDKKAISFVNAILDKLSKTRK